MKEPKPWYGEQLNYYSEIRQADGTVQQIMVENDEDPQKTRKAILLSKMSGRRLLCDEFDVVLYANKGNKVEAYVLIPRQPKLLKKDAFLVACPSNYCFDLPMSKLASTLAELDAKYAVPASVQGEIPALAPQVH